MRRRASRSSACSRPTHTRGIGKRNGSRTAKDSWSACSAATRSLGYTPSPDSSGSRRFRPAPYGPRGRSPPPRATAATSRTSSPECTTLRAIAGYPRASRCPSDSLPHAYQETFRNWDAVLWAETHDELRYGSGEWDTVLREGWFGGVFEWALLHPRIEFPPFDNELSFVVARTGGCVDLREQPGEGALALDCLPDGTRVSLSCGAGCNTSPHLSSYLDHTLLRVRTADDLDGWVPFDYLDHE